MTSSGKQFRKALREENPLQIVGVINAYAAIMAARAGYRAIYLSGAGVANASYGLPDLGMTSMNDVLEDVGPYRCIGRGGPGCRPGALG